MNALTTADRYWQTIRHLRPGQITGRIRYRLASPRPDQSPPPPTRDRVGTWQVPARRRPSLTGPGHFMFLNEAGSLEENGWDDPGKDKLWRYNQHYLDDLNADNPDGRSGWHQILVASWIIANPPGTGTGWEPYPTSLRLVNWIKWVLSGNEPGQDMLASLAVQTRWLTKRLEWHLLGNHLLANAKALVFAGLFFDGAEARQWLQTGVGILEREIPEQILSDGAHFELSPMYHALILEDFLDLTNVSRAFQAGTEPLFAAISERIPPMIEWLQAMSHPDGRISFFNDAAFGIAPENQNLIDYAQRLGFFTPTRTGSNWLQDSGYFRFENQRAVVIADFARVGPDYLPGHAHADTLSFEASLFGHRVLVNSGTSLYGTGPERLRQRGTDAHNTVTVAGTNSSEVWGGFRVARRARVFDVSCDWNGEAQTACASHDGYTRLPDRPVHRRSITLSGECLEIFDSVTPTEHESVARFHLHPDVAIEQTSASSGIIRLPADQTLTWDAGDNEPCVTSTTWHPEFGKIIKNRCLVIPLRDNRSILKIRWD